jgi:glycerol uptake facilitator-like aquaporin
MKFLVTVALASLGKFPLRKVPHYLISQFLGGFAAAAVVYLTYFEGINLQLNTSLHFNSN